MTREITTRYYYDGSNVIIETNESDATQRSYVNGSQYIDERVLMRDHTETIGPGNDEYQDHYHLLAELYSVAGLADCRGWLEEVAVYDTYGHATIYDWPAGDMNRDGTKEKPADPTVIADAAGQSSTAPFMDANLDGIVYYDDAQAVWDLPDASAVQINYSSVDNPYFFTGRLTDTWHADNILVSEDPDFRRVQDNRNRTYDPKHGRCDGRQLELPPSDN